MFFDGYDLYVGTSVLGSTVQLEQLAMRAGGADRPVAVQPPT